jgi:D-alanine-D-alanine ligase-like ATP-grasp enzyme
MSQCIYCGNNPVSHLSHKFYESFDILLGPMRHKIFQSRFGDFTDKLTDLLALGLFHLLKPLGLIQINRDIKEIKYPRAQVLWEEASRRKIMIEEIKPFGRSIDLYRAFVNDKPIYFMNLPRIEKTAVSNLIWVDDKFLLKKKLLEHHLPVSPGGSFTSLDSATRAFEVLEKPVIVKPRTGSRGRHTTTFVSSEEDFIKAFKIAKQLCHWVVIEEHLYGDVQRGTVVGGQLVGVLGGSPPRVTGDGKSTIQELILLKDANRPKKVKEIKINPYFMQRMNLTMETILPDGKTVDLSEKIGVNYGGTSYDCTPQTHPDTKKMFEEAAKVLDVSILGFDFIVPDITKSYKEQKCGIIECNGAPFIQLHHDPLIGESINAAKFVWDLVEKNPDASVGIPTPMKSASE